MQIRVQNNGLKIDFQLNDSQAAKSLVEQLPLTLDVDNFGGNEKIFYPDQKLDIANTELATSKNGNLCYYAPWGDVVMFFNPYNPGSGLYNLGKVINGKENIQKLNGTITVTKLD